MASLTFAHNHYATRFANENRCSFMKNCRYQSSTNLTKEQSREADKATCLSGVRE